MSIIALPEKNTFIHFPDAELVEMDLVRSATCPGAMLTHFLESSAAWLSAPIVLQQSSVDSPAVPSPQASNASNMNYMTPLQAAKAFTPILCSLAESDPLKDPQCDISDHSALRPGSESAPQTSPARQGSLAGPQKRKCGNFSDEAVKHPSHVRVDAGDSRSKEVEGPADILCQAEATTSLEKTDQSKSWADISSEEEDEHAVQDADGLDVEGWVAVSRKKGRKNAKEQKPSESSEQIRPNEAKKKLGGDKRSSHGASKGFQNETKETKEKAGNGSKTSGSKTSFYPSRTRSSSSSSSKFLCRYMVGIKQDQAFNVVQRLLGPSGSYLKYIAEESGAKLRIRGQGSGFLEGPEQQEASSEPLMICVRATSSRSLTEATELLESLIKDVHEEHSVFCKERGLPVLQLAVVRIE